MKAVLDACVIYAATVRDLLVRLTIAKLYQAHWTNQIHDEWISKLLKNRPDLNRAVLERTRMLMDFHAKDSLVTNHTPLIDLVQLPDPKDRHVLAAAIASQAQYIVTFNLKDFPEQSLIIHNLKAIHPDLFLSMLFDQNRVGFLECMTLQLQNLRNPPVSFERYIQNLESQGLIQIAKRIRLAFETG